MYQGKLLTACCRFENVACVVVTTLNTLTAMWQKKLPNNAKLATSNLNCVCWLLFCHKSCFSIVEVNFVFSF